MKLLSLECSNFGSYKHLEIDYENEGLHLLYGPTGAGKSTLFDMPCWALFGVTAKGGSVDEVRPWHPGAATTVRLAVEAGDKVVVIHRVRGRSSENDLYYCIDSTDPVRGKDLSDTQGKLNALLGVSLDDYLTSTYFHEFNPLISFFSLKPKARRECLESLADLSFPELLQRNLIDVKKEARESIQRAEETYSRLVDRTAFLEAEYKANADRRDRWDARQQGILQDIKRRAEGFKYAREQKLSEIERQIQANQLGIERITEIEKDLATLTAARKEAEKSKVTCDACGQLTANSHLLEIQRGITACMKEIAPMYTKRERIESLVKQRVQVEADTGEAIRQELASREFEVNPYAVSLSEYDGQIAELEEKTADSIRELTTLRHRYSALEHLGALALQLRSKLLADTIDDIKYRANAYLRNFFDGEFYVDFTPDSKEGLAVEITKDGSSCSYTQLSKGQRSLLRLCFMVACMSRAQERSASFGLMFFDEALDGLDSSLKLKAYRLFESLSASVPNVYVIDHDTGLREFFSSRVEITLSPDGSVLSYD